MSSERLKVIALVSGGKDSFFSLLHCLAHGHSVVALANLYPAGDADAPSSDDGVHFVDPSAEGFARGAGGLEASSPQQDLNSFMYQTVGHEVVPLYAAATGLPLYRQPIVGGAVRHERDYDYAAVKEPTPTPGSSSPDETESMLSLLQAVMARHPEANAVCAGAILSTYQRTRVESIALRLGLVPLAYLWKYPILPHPRTSAAPPDDAQLLQDMAAVGLEARIIKVASAGLDEGHLWERVTSDTGAARVKRALSRFGAAEGAALGEGGEFETIVLDGPSHLFKKRISVPDDGKTVIREGGGSNWLMIRGAHLEDKPPVQTDEATIVPPSPDLLDPAFASLFDNLTTAETVQASHKLHTSSLLSQKLSYEASPLDLLSWSVSAAPTEHGGTIEDETLCVVAKIKQLLSSTSLEASQVTTVVIILRDMSAFPKVNGVYGKLFTKPNPPSRVTISCGDLLPEGSNIVIYLTIPANSELRDRNGLHVQSRSYWAPANIGPYSQAIEAPVTLQQKPIGLRAVSVAGQIPLIPASMELPVPSDTSLQMEIVLSLQHLWRIAAEMRIQYWSSAVAYFARSTSDADIQRSADYASRAWKRIHAPAEDEDDADDAVDPWDLKYNPQYASLGHDSKPGGGRRLPDWSVLTLRQQNEPDSCIPPFFAVEVESLPRQSAVEWHAHAGLSQVSDSSLEIVQCEEVGLAGWRACHTIVRAPEASFVHTVVSCTLTAALEDTTWEASEKAMAAAYIGSLKHLHVKASDAEVSGPYLAYVDTVKLPAPWTSDGKSNQPLPFAVIPCSSIWSTEGERVGLVGVYRTGLSVSDSS
jgi:uncharacterized protein (TIGR00290 family)